MVRDTRVLVSSILGALSGGDSIEMILENSPNLSEEDIDALEFAGQAADYQVLEYDVV